MAAAAIHVTVVSAEEAYNGNAEFWCGDELMAMTILDDGQLRLRIEARADGAPWVVDTTRRTDGRNRQRPWSGSAEAPARA